MQEETELKLSLPREQADRLRRHPLIRNLKAGRAQTKRMVGTYFDTPDLSLKRRDLSLRLREVDKRWIQTLKRLGPASGGLAVRDEWEFEVAEPKPDTSRIDCKELRKVLPGADEAASLR
ncbi:MAG: CYTH domain-containing protein, partial [Alphaproteobacteria bacterium]|nr:CYTH domain-containing protein [Alphaproteobacteria bacterium]